MSHFMLHTHHKEDIVKSWKRNKAKLILAMLGVGDLMKSMEPILMIADYYGERKAMYFTFLIHHISLLFIPAFFGLLLWGYHLYLATQFEPEEGKPGGFIVGYFSILDTKWNYPYLFLLAIWSTIYIESWKRK